VDVIIALQWMFGALAASLPRWRCRSLSFQETLKLTNCSEFFGNINPVSIFALIFSVLGTPDDKIWPGVSELPDFKPDFPQWPVVPLESIVTTLDPLGIDLLKV
jgi:hypothetical protein